jgi:hypothetical protein
VTIGRWCTGVYRTGDQAMGHDKKLPRFVGGRRPRRRIYTGEINSAFIKTYTAKTNVSRRATARLRSTRLAHSHVAKFNIGLGRCVAHSPSATGRSRRMWVRALQRRMSVAPPESNS